MARKVKAIVDKKKSTHKNIGNKNSVGAGRPKGSEAKKTKMLREISERALNAGITPLEVMLENMRFYHADHDEFVRKVAKEEGMSLADARAALHLRELAQNAAKDAAPYTNPRLAAIQHTGRHGGPIETINSKMDPKQAAEAYAATLKDDSDIGFEEE